MASTPPGTFLTGAWRNLVLLNYEVDPALVRGHVPRGTELDDWNGRTFVSLVAFQFLETRVLGLPIPRHRNFEELNLRFYVRRVAGSEVRRGVVFLREVVPRRAVALLARLLYNEPYIRLPMRSRVTPGEHPAMEYGWRLDRRWHTIAARAAGRGVVPAPDTFQSFITEHYWGYTRQRDGSTVEYRVRHERWRVWQVSELALEANLADLYGPELGAALAGPSSAFIADGSAVTVGRPVRLEGRGSP